MSEPLYIQTNLGLGDMLLQNGLVRVLNKKFPEIVLPSWAHNLDTIRFMFRDLPGIRVEPVDYDGINVFGDNHRRLRLGHYAIDGFDVKIFDKEFYRQAGVPFEERWNSFYVQPHEALSYVGTDLAFFHDDAERGFKIDAEKYYPFLKSRRPLGMRNFFDYIKELQNCKEVHCIDSSFLCLWDSLPHVEGQKLFLHSYARDSIAPTLKKNWTVLK